MNVTNNITILILSKYMQLCGNLYILRCVRYHFGAVVDWDVGYFHHYSPILPRVPASSSSGGGPSSDTANNVLK